MGDVVEIRVLNDDSPERVIHTGVEVSNCDLHMLVVLVVEIDMTGHMWCVHCNNGELSFLSV